MNILLTLSFFLIGFMIGTVAISIFEYFHDVIVNIINKSNNDTKKCDIITVLNRYNDIDCNTVVMYDDYITFCDNGIAVTVDAQDTNIKFND